VQAFLPFCSKRCADIDLARWLGGAYAIIGEPADPEAPDRIEPEAADGNAKAAR
jgi:endogenous inhibitor of DNA gyrase (YacG/DUF329 family)